MAGVAPAFSPRDENRAGSAPAEGRGPRVFACFAGERGYNPAMSFVRKATVFVGLLALLSAPSFSAAAKSGEKKPRDFVGRADQKRDRRGMYHFESGAYKISADIDRDLANDIAGHMDEVYKEYDTRFRGFRPNPYAAVRPNEKMPLYVLRKYADYIEFLSTFGVNGANSGGVFFRTADGQSGLATWAQGQSRLKMYYVLQHEGFHQFADARIMFDLPPWVNEGLAEYFGDAVCVNGKLLIGRLDRERIDRMRRAIKEGETLPFEQLMTMSSQAWVGRVTSGDKAAALMYDSAWSVCYFLVHGGKRSTPLQIALEGQRGPALEGYLRLLNRNFVKDPRRDRRAEAFETVFGRELKNFEAAWKEGLEKLEPDPWFSSVRHLQFIAAALKAFHAKGIEVKSWPQLKEQLIRHNFRTTIRERDAVNRGERKEQVEDVEQNFDFPAPAEVEFVPSDEAKLPAGLRITNVTPNILLSWTLNSAGKVEEDISYVDAPKLAKQSGGKSTRDAAKRETKSATPAQAETGK